MRLLVVIVNYRTADLTIDCLRSLSSELPPIGPARVVVSDNQSGDGSLDTITAAIRSNNWAFAETAALERNGGFAYGNNQVIGRALTASDKPQYVLLLNPDTVPRPGALVELLKFMDKNPSVGIAGSRLEDPDGTAQRSAFRFHSVCSEFERGINLGLVSRLLEGKVVAPPPPETAVQTDWVAGASMIVRREVFEKIGLLDEKYFMYFEEVDFCLAASRAGWQCWYVPSSRVVHLVGAASEVSDARKHRKRRPTYWFDSRRRYFVKNHGVTYAALADVAFAMGFALWRMRRFVQRKADTDPPRMLGDFIRNSVFVRGCAI